MVILAQCVGTELVTAQGLLLHLAAGDAAEHPVDVAVTHAPHPMEPLARELRAWLASEALDARSRVELSDGLIVNLERMVRIVLADFERVAWATDGSAITEGEKHALSDDRLRLHSLALARRDSIVRLSRPASARVTSMTR